MKSRPHFEVGVRVTKVNLTINGWEAKLVSLVYNGPVFSLENNTLCFWLRLSILNVLCLKRPSYFKGPFNDNYKNLLFCFMTLVLILVL